MANFVFGTVSDRFCEIPVFAILSLSEMPPSPNSPFASRKPHERLDQELKLEILALLDSGVKPAKIVEDLGLSKSQVYRIKSSREKIKGAINKKFKRAAAEERFPEVEDRLLIWILLFYLISDYKKIKGCPQFT
jgi:hypothetical protein